ncbi:MAG TPA: MBL fold metallo-hydrolase [Polyangiaceae bacterium]|jgi:L-ascorbate metabolism protein UlaG (beta-lactamase superfamily)
MRALPVLVLPLLIAGVLACSKEPPSPTGAASATPSGDPPSSGTPASASSAQNSPRATDHFATTKGDLAVVPLEHASVLFQWHGEAVYVDPTSSAVADASLPKADVVFLTHTHPDHFDPAAIERLRKRGTVIVGPQAVADKTHVDVVMANGDTKQVADVTATAVPMYNLKRGPAAGKLYHDKGQGNGYELDLGGTRIYLSGDTECTPEMKALEKIDIAFVCMNLPYTMPPSEAAECIAAFRPKVVFPYHYRGSNLGELDAPLAGKGIDVRKRDWYPGQGK